MRYESLCVGQRSARKHSEAEHSYLIPHTSYLIPRTANDHLCVKIAIVRRLLAIALLLASCSKAEAPAPPSAPRTEGDAPNGAQLLAQYGCNSCHNIPGVQGPKGSIAPSLEHTASKPVIAGKFPSAPETMVRWLENPQSLDPQSTMPNLGVTERDARDMTAYLFTLR
ncbi:MAG: cytochrome c class [Acidobacteria bacterium]|nr:cytochrome c class [Acidobacteriota bacterium]